MQLFVLVDYDNVKEQRRERSREDSSYNVARIAEAASQVRARSFAAYKDVRIRLYGGWTDNQGARLERAIWVAESCANIRGRRLGGRIVAEMAYGLFDTEFSLLRGLYRDGGQKMVDTLMVVDATRITLAYDAKAVIMSDDEDMLPGLLASHIHGPVASIIRTTAAEGWRNASTVYDCGVLIESGSLL